MIHRTQEIASLNTVDMAHPSLPMLRAITKKRSPIMLIIELVIRNRRGDLLSPRARNVLAKQLYIYVKSRPANIILK